MSEIGSFITITPQPDAPGGTTVYYEASDVLTDDAANVVLYKDNAKTEVIAIIDAADYVPELELPRRGHWFEILICPLSSPLTNLCRPSPAGFLLWGGPGTATLYGPFGRTFWPGSLRHRIDP